MPNELPLLTPEMLLSYTGMRELEGAQATQQRPAASAPPNTVDVEMTFDSDALEQIAVAAQDEDYISFDRSDLDVEDELPFQNRAAGERFNVLRPPQQPQMREVGRVGRFPILAPDEPPPRPVPERNNSPRQQLHARELNEKMREQLIEQRAAIHESLPTAYDRLLDEDPYEDDLE